MAINSRNDTLLFIVYPNDLNALIASFLHTTNLTAVINRWALERCLPLPLNVAVEWGVGGSIRGSHLRAGCWNTLSSRETLQAGFGVIFSGWMTHSESTQPVQTSRQLRGFLVSVTLTLCHRFLLIICTHFHGDPECILWEPTWQEKHLKRIEGIMKRWSVMGGGQEVDIHNHCSLWSFRCSQFINRVILVTMQPHRNMFLSEKASLCGSGPASSGWLYNIHATLMYVF